VDELAAQATAWAAAYEEAWRSAGTDRLAELFTDEAEYSPAPFAAPIRGFGAIARMWEAERDGADEEFAMAAELVAASDGRAVVRVEVRYGAPARQHYRDLWVLHLTADGRCERFEEWPFWPPGTDGTIAGCD
jgi:hypothetical protein